MPYPVDPRSVMGVVDVEDVAEAAVRVLSDPSVHVGATYDLSAEELTRDQMAEAWSQVVGHPVTAVRIPPASITNPLRS
ncbi:MAG: NmrA family NAD(P)-binding protein, partial [Aeromicrobium erythreum]